jgi:hypothetical protein
MAAAVVAVAVSITFQVTHRPASEVPLIVNIFGTGMLASVMNNTARGKAALHSAMEKCLVRCFLNVTSVLNCEDGLVCVAISCANRGARNAGKDVKNVYVAPQDLRMPESDRQWEESLSYVLV